ncbi:MAG: carboxypeptidase regulatory-like domain-containing protein [Chloroflexi bacterium]|nr:carboxypeptidase regulatory-like domain-containing protein [Chloroflexota bacterium]MCI0580701.1 carboxypeptidase regulatory-like domain-containing protein [Chloroflexota bacterium]MCI0648568.1 carboxypeptidase regulatory-like domain-containing protein [Chloroflexota bacterium]MCI0727331.1 carboxypeptidase regulatory-like domain-containing protein [Chloroflexota bacterium]
MKRILVLLVGILTIFLVACGGGGGEEPDAATQPPPTVVEEGGGEEPEPAAGGYQGGTVSDGGTISGKITYSGPAVEPETVETDKDQEVCGDSIEITRVKTDASGGLANAIVRITDISSGKPLDTLGSDFVLDQNGCEYVPAALVVPVGSAITILNSDGILHNIHTTPFDNPPLNIAQPATEPEVSSDPFTIPEIIPVSCDVHSWMEATLIVVDNPYAVTTGEDGSFTLDDVPAGTYTIEVWHAELGTQTMTVTVEAGGTATADVEFE